MGNVTEDNFQEAIGESVVNAKGGSVVFVGERGEVRLAAHDAYQFAMGEGVLADKINAVRQTIGEFYVKAAPPPEANEPAEESGSEE